MGVSSPAGSVQKKKTVIAGEVASHVRFMLTYETLTTRRDGRADKFSSR